MTALSSTALAALEKLYEAATPKPWFFQEIPSDSDCPASIASSEGAYAVAMCPRYGFGQFKKNAAAIVALFNAFPSLAATIRASKARIGELEAETIDHVNRYKRISDELDHLHLDVARVLNERDAALAEVEQLNGEIGNWENDFLSEMYNQASTPSEYRIVALARATHPAPPEWRDAIEAVAKWLENAANVFGCVGAGDRAEAQKLVDAQKVLQEAAEQIRALPPPSTSASPWRDIASAPDKRPDILVFCPEDEETGYVAHCEICSVTGGCLESRNGDGPMADGVQPTHWMPLPVLPTTPAAEGEDGR